MVDIELNKLRVGSSVDKKKALIELVLTELSHTSPRHKEIIKALYMPLETRARLLREVGPADINAAISAFEPALNKVKLAITQLTQTIPHVAKEIFENLPENDFEERVLEIKRMHDEIEAAKKRAEQKRDSKAKMGNLFKELEKGRKRQLV